MNLITGASGLIGRHLTMQGYRPSHQELDLTDYRTIEKCIKKYKPEKILHLAGLKKDCRDYKEARKVNVEGTKILYETAKEYGLKKFVYTSTAGVYCQKSLSPTKETQNIDPRTVYARTKLEAEKILSKDDLVFRIFNIYGEGFAGSLVNKLVSGRHVVLNDVDNYYRDYVHVSDVVGILEEGMQNEAKGIMNLCTGSARSTRSLVEYLEGVGVSMDYTIYEQGKFDISVGSTKKLQRYFKVPNYLIKLT